MTMAAPALTGTGQTPTPFARRPEPTRDPRRRPPPPLMTHTNPTLPTHPHTAIAQRPVIPAPTQRHSRTLTSSFPRKRESRVEQGWAETHPHKAVAQRPAAWATSVGQPSGISLASRADSMASAASSVIHWLHTATLPFSHQRAASFVLASGFSFCQAATAL